MSIFPCSWRYEMPIGGAAATLPPGAVWQGDFWRRCTQEEGEDLDAAMEQAPARLKRIAQTAQYFDPADPDYPTLRDVIVSALKGKTQRADELLAPS